MTIGWLMERLLPECVATVCGGRRHFVSLDDATARQLGGCCCCCSCGLSVNETHARWLWIAAAKAAVLTASSTMVGQLVGRNFLSGVRCTHCCSSAAVPGGGAAGVRNDDTED